MKTEHEHTPTPTPWFVADWTNDYGNDLTTIEARKLEILHPGQSSIWPGGIEKLRIADTSEGENPLADAAFICEAVNSHAQLKTDNAALAARVKELEEALTRIAECHDREPDDTCAACGKLARAALAGKE